MTQNAGCVLLRGPTAKDVDAWHKERDGEATQSGNALQGSYATCAAASPDFGVPGRAKAMSSE